jgi:hypothetical protein
MDLSTAIPFQACLEPAIAYLTTCALPLAHRVFQPYCGRHNQTWGAQTQSFSRMLILSFLWEQSTAERCLIYAETVPSGPLQLGLIVFVCNIRQVLLCHIFYIR